MKQQNKYHSEINNIMLLEILLLRYISAKIVVVDDLGLTDGRYTASPKDAARVISALGDTMKKSSEEVLLSNSTGMHRIINDLDCSIETTENCGSQDKINPLNRSPSPGKAKIGEAIAGTSTIGKAVARKYTREAEEYIPSSNGWKAEGGRVDGGRIGEGSHGGNSNGKKTSSGMYGPFSMRSKHSILEAYKPSNISQLTSLLSENNPALGDANPLEMDLMRKEQDGMTGASRARESYIRLKISQSRLKEREIQTEVDKNQQHLDQTVEKLQEMEKTKERILSKLHSERNHIRNLESNKKEVEVQRARTASLVRLARNELLKLTKIIDDQKSKLGVLEDEEQVFSDRIKKYDEDYEMEGRELQFDEARLEEMRRDITELERIRTVFKARTNEFINQKNKEISLRSRLMLEKERLERNTIDFV
jgi:hypothetical protein